MKKLLIIAAVFGLALMSPKPAQAVYIVDTGTPTGTIAWSLYNETSLTGAYQSLAGQFSLSETYTLNSLEGYMKASVFSVLTSIDAVLYADVAGSLNESDELFRQSFLIPAQSGSVLNIWTGVFDIDYDLAAGTYWLAFEAQDGTPASSMLEGPPSPLSKYEVSNLSTTGYQENRFDFGIRIDADAKNQDPRTVPEPTSMALLATGLAGAMIRRKLGA